MQRSGAKFYISEKEYFASRQEKLKVQLRRDGGSEDAGTGASEAGDVGVSGIEVAQSSDNPASGHLKKIESSKTSETRDEVRPPKQIFGESASVPRTSCALTD